MKPAYIFYFCLAVVFNLQLNAQTVITVDSIQNKTYVISAAPSPKTFYIQEFINQRPTKKGKFTTLPSNKDELKIHTAWKGYMRPYLLNNFFAIPEHLLKNQKDNIYRDFEMGHLIDSIVEYNLIGGISRIIILHDEHEIERFELNGHVRVQHSKLWEGTLRDTAFFFEGYKALMLNENYKVIRLTKYHKGQFDETIIDPRKTFKHVEYLNLTNGHYYNMADYNENNRSAIEIQKLSRDKYAIKVNKNIYSRDFQHVKYIIEKRLKRNMYGRAVPDFDNNYRLLEQQVFNRKNEMTLLYRFDQKGSFTLYQQKYSFNCHSEPCTPMNLTISSGKQHLYYKSNTFSGSLKREKTSWVGIDTFYMDQDIVTTKLLITDFNLSYERFVNGQLMSKGNHDCPQCDISELNYLYEDEMRMDFAVNPFLERIDRAFHNDLYIDDEYDRIRVGKDSFVQMKLADSGFHIKLFTPTAQQLLFFQNYRALSVVKDQNNCLVGAMDQTGKMVIPCKYEEIEAIYINSATRFYFCSINGHGTFLNNDGSTIISMRRGLTDRAFPVSETFRSKHQLLIPYVFVCNDADSFKVITFNDETLFCGEGRFDFILSKHYQISTNGLKTLMQDDGTIIGKNAVFIHKILPDLYLIKQEKNKGELKTSSTLAEYPDTEDEDKAYTYTLNDLKSDSFDSLIFDDCINLDFELTILKKKGMTLFIHSGNGIYLDSANLEFTRLSQFSYQIKHYNRYGLILTNSIKIIPAKYSSILNNGTTINAQRGDTMDIYNWGHELLFSIHLKEDQRHKHLGIKNNSDYYADFASRFENRGLYKVRLGNKFGLYDTQGHEILKPEYESIELGSKPDEENDALYPLLDVYNDDLLIKLQKENVAELHVLRGLKTIKLKVPLLWACGSPKQSVVVDTNGRLFPPNRPFKIDYKNHKITFFGKYQLSIKSEMDLWGNETFNASKFIKSTSINGLLYVQLKNGKCGILNNKREYKIEPIYSDIYLDDQNQLLWYKYGHPNEKWKLKSLANNVLMSDSFDFPCQIAPNIRGIDKDFYFPYSKDGKYGIMRGDGKVELPAQFDHFTSEYGQIYLLAKEKAFYSWSTSDRILHQLAAKSIYHSKFENEDKSGFGAFRHYSHAFKDQTMYIIKDGAPLTAIDSSNGLFFNKIFNIQMLHAWSSKDHSINSFIVQQKNNLDYINTLIKSTVEPSWQSLSAMPCFPTPITTTTAKNRISFNYFSNNIKQPIKYSNYTRLDYTHLKDKKMSICNNGAYTLSLTDEHKFKYLNIYIDSLLGYLVFDINDLFKSEGEEALISLIQKKWLAMNDPYLPCIEKDKIIEYVVERFYIDNNRLVFKLEDHQTLQFPIAELKHFMTEFWQKRF